MSRIMNKIFKFLKLIYRKSRGLSAIVYAVLFILTIFQYLYTAASDPGYLVDGERDEWLVIGNRKAQKEIINNAYGNNRNLNSKCFNCNIYKPPRSKHCHHCNKCILQYDHHCPWLNTCIGYGNHCRFWWYLLEETILCFWTFIMFISSYRTKTSSGLRWRSCIIIICLTLLFFLLFFLVLLLLFHSYLASTNQTSHEVTRRKRISEIRDVPLEIHPYSKGCVQNIYYFCCTPQVPYEIQQIPSLEILKQREHHSCMQSLYFNCC
ncbi:hypothetical protein KP509_07G031400 [Ceratopteris richardii]|uniref:S-acyltransferase n=1 Tax=Ceratopteris richardii TaxID=49495 RepID=A0A8T2UFH3_CERRI|nr:hypothetical protein KP509_07G031400 [Ceratopteris richardii]